MKKTIAILLILVLAGVGLFAAGFTTPAATSAHLTINTTIAEVNLMKLTAGAAEPEWDESADLAISATSFVKTEYTPNTPDAYLHTKSNHRGGYTVTMKAEPLLSGTAGTSDAQYLGYSVKTSDGTDDFVSTATEEGVSGDVQTIITVAAGSSFMTHITRSIFVKIDSTLSDAFAGVYDGQITFAYTAN